MNGYRLEQLLVRVNITMDEYIEVASDPELDLDYHDPGVSISYYTEQLHAGWNVGEKKAILTNFHGLCNFNL